MEIVKAAQGGGSMEVSARELEAINALSRRDLKEDEVYLFCVRLCDNEVDRDGERFAPETLETLAPMFVGKSGIFDHQWSAKGQSARIYRTELVREESKLTRAGDGYCWLKGYVYMLRSEQTQGLIEEIDAGIKKEVSVGCSVERRVCSVCGADRNHQTCGHDAGEYYDGKLCYVSLEGALDAYEFSFVAVPAQPAAGVVKGMDRDCADLKALCRRYPACESQLKKLEEEAALGRACRKSMENEAVKLALLCGLGLEAEQLREMVGAMSADHLEKMRGSWEKQARKKYPLHIQLEYHGAEEHDRQRDGAFLI